MKRPLRSAATGGMVVIGAAAMFLAGTVAGVASAAPAATHAAPAPAKHAAPAPTTKVPGTNCTLAQVEKAIAKEDPALWKKIESNPKAKKHFEERIVKARDHAKKPNHKKGDHTKTHEKAQHRKSHAKDHKKLTPAQRAERRAEMLALRVKVAATCARY